MAIDGTAVRATQALPAATGSVGQQKADSAAQNVRAVAVEIRKPEPAKKPRLTQQAPDVADLKKQIESINRQMKERQRDLSFRVDEGTGKTVVRVVRESTGELVRQIPSEEVMAVAASIEAALPVETLGIEAWT